MNPMCDKNGGKYRGGRRKKAPTTCDNGLFVQKIAEGQTSYKWRVQRDSFKKSTRIGRLMSIDRHY